MAVEDDFLFTQKIYPSVTLPPIVYAVELLSVSVDCFASQFSLDVTE